MSELVNPLAMLNDEALYASTLSLVLLCQRNKGVLKKPRRQHVCALAEVLKIELLDRGRPVPQAPYHVGDVKA